MPKARFSLLTLIFVTPIAAFVFWWLSLPSYEERLDAAVERLQDNLEEIDARIGKNGARNFPITDLPQRQRDCYLVFDLVAIAGNAGTKSWVHYHHNEPGWIDGAAQGLRRIGHDDSAAWLLECLAKYRTDPEFKDDEFWYGRRDVILHNDEAIFLDLDRYLASDS